MTEEEKIEQHARTMYETKRGEPREEPWESLPRGVRRQWLERARKIREGNRNRLKAQKAKQ